MANSILEWRDCCINICYYIQGTVSLEEDTFVAKEGVWDIGIGDSFAQSGCISGWCAVQACASGVCECVVGGACQYAE